MRILGFSRKDWKNYLTGRPKLEQNTFTTFRFARKDKDWEVGEAVQVVYKPRRKGGGERLGVAEITSKESRQMVTPPLESDTLYWEAKADGFANYNQMWEWLYSVYRNRIFNEPMNRLTLRWVKRSNQ